MVTDIIAPLRLVSAMATTVGTGWRVTLSLIKGDQGVLEVEADESTAHMIRPIMRNVVTHRRGTGKKANAFGYAVGGKTGTSEKNKVGGYDRRSTSRPLPASSPPMTPDMLSW